MYLPELKASPTNDVQDTLAMENKQHRKQNTYVQITKNCGHETRLQNWKFLIGNL